MIKIIKSIIIPVISFSGKRPNGMDELFRGNLQFAFEFSGKIEVKDKGAMEMWFVEYA